MRANNYLLVGLPWSPHFNPTHALPIDGRERRTPIPTLRKFTLTKNPKTGTWDLKEDNTRQVIHSFKNKQNAKKDGVIKKLLGKPGGSVRFELEKGGYDEERTYPRSHDLRSSKG